jgi:hypothetical protein
MSYPHLLFQELKCRGYKHKGVGKITYHFGGDFFRNPDGTFAQWLVLEVTQEMGTVFSHSDPILSAR